MDQSSQSHNADHTKATEDEVDNTDNFSVDVVSQPQVRQRRIQEVVLFLDKSNSRQSFKPKLDGRSETLGTMKSYSIPKVSPFRDITIQMDR